MKPTHQYFQKSIPSYLNEILPLHGTIYILSKQNGMILNQHCHWISERVILPSKVNMLARNVDFTKNYQKEFGFFQDARHFIK